MKEVFVLYGRVYCRDGVFYDCCGDCCYFEESPVLEVFDNFDDAYMRFKKYVKSAYNWFKEYNPYQISEENVEKTAGAELFDDYNMYKDDYPEDDVQWTFDVHEGRDAHWQMYPVNISIIDPCTILPGLYIEKKEINPDITDYD